MPSRKSSRSGSKSSRSGSKSSERKSSKRKSSVRKTSGRKTSGRKTSKRKVPAKKNGKFTWVGFVKDYARRHNIEYGQALSQAKHEWADYKN